MIQYIIARSVEDVKSGLPKQNFCSPLAGDGFWGVARGKIKDAPLNGRGGVSFCIVALDPGVHTRTSLVGSYELSASCPTLPGRRMLGLHWWFFFLFLPYGLLGEFALGLFNDGSDFGLHWTQVTFDLGPILGKFVLDLFWGHERQ